MKVINKVIVSKGVHRKTFDFLIKFITPQPKSFRFSGLFIRFIKLFVTCCFLVVGRFRILPIKYTTLSLAFFYMLNGEQDKSLMNFRKSALFGFPKLNNILNGVARAQLYVRHYKFSHHLLEIAFGLDQRDANVAYCLGLSCLLLRQPESAIRFIEHSIHLDRRYGMAHQNLAARYDRNAWVPTEFDLIGDPDLHLYDAYHFLGQLLISSADVERGLELFGSAMTVQNRLAEKYSVPTPLIEELQKIEGYHPDKSMRILSYEWITQIGHEGMLDALLKMQKLGMRPDCNWVLLAPTNKIANASFLQCFKPYIVIVEDISLINALFPYQRVCGEQFNCYVDEQGNVVDWSDMAAKAFIEWDRQGRNSLLTVPNSIKNAGKDLMTAFGVPEDAWFVALHVRSGGYYNEGNGFIQKHRNAQLKSYLPAIRRIHKAGGWVVRMGDPSMEPLKEMPMTIDMAHSPYRSKSLDVYFWSNARFFLGTTSGPTNAVIAFHTPTLLVNCISNYAQSWNRHVMFILKPIWSHDAKRFLKISEVFTPQFRAKIFNINNLVREGIYPKPNSASDILDATEEMLEYLENGGLPQMQESSLLENVACDFWLWGNAHPSKSFFIKNRKQLVG